MWEACRIPPDAGADAGTLVNTQPCGAQLGLHRTRQNSPSLCSSISPGKTLHQCQEVPGAHSIPRLSFWCAEGTRSLEELQGQGALSLGTARPPPPPPGTHRQVLRGEAAQTRQVPPGGSVELLHLLRQLLLEAPLLLVLLGVRELHHDR